MNIDFDSLTEKHRHVLGCIAMAQDGGHHRRSLESLVNRGLIVATKEKMYGSGNSPIDRMAMTVTRYHVPLAVHIAWCQWCSENYTKDEA